MLTGQVPFMGNTYPDLVLKIITGDAPPPHALVPSLPGGLSRVVMKALALERDHRFQRVSEFAAALEALGYARAETIPRVSSVSPPGTVTPFAAERVAEGVDDMPSIVPKRPVGAWLGASAAAAILLGGGLWMLSGHDAAGADGVGAAGASPAAVEDAPLGVMPAALPSAAPAAMPSAAPDAGARADEAALPSGIVAPASTSEHHGHRSHHEHRRHGEADPNAPQPQVLTLTPNAAPGTQPAARTRHRTTVAQPAAPQPRSELIDPF
jgi:hypothetical protein